MAQSTDKFGMVTSAVTKSAIDTAADTVPGIKARNRRRCGRCGTSVPNEFLFCGACGFNLSDDKAGRVFRDPLIGVVVGDRYRLLSRVGIGGMGTVYKAEHTRMGKVVAVKLLHGDLSRNVSMIRRFNREARAASRLSSPHTVSVFDYGQTEGLIYIVMEYLRGLDLGQVLRRRGHLSAPATARVLAQVASSLSEAHANGIVHRDLKPENIFLCATDGDMDSATVKVLDFGLAKLREARDESFDSTAHGQLVGTPFYMSPEQIDGHEVDLRSDIYSLGAVVFKLLTGDPPYDHDNAVAVLGQHLSAPIPLPSEAEPDLRVVDSVVQRALAKKPSDRYPTVVDFANEFSRALRDPNEVRGELGTSGLEISTVGLEDVSTRRDFDRFERNLKLKRVGGVLMALLILASAGYLFWWGVIQRSLEHSEVETEPNDSPQQADKLFFGEEMRGFIGIPAVGQRADNDFYLVENDTGGPISVRLEISGVPGLDLVVKTYDSQAQDLVVVNAGGEGDPELLPNLFVADHYTYIQVREYWVRNQIAHHNLDVPYLLTVSHRVPLFNEEREPNERVTEALQTREGDVYLGLMGWPDDLDVYRAPELNAGGEMVTATVTGAADIDLELRFYDITGTELFHSDRAPAGETETVTFFAAPEGHGALYVGVAAVEPDASQPEEHYELTIELSPVEALRGPTGFSP